MHRKLAPTLASCIVLLAACAGERPRPAPQRVSPLPPPTMPRSSIAAVLDHRGELALDDGQVAKLEQLERDLERKQTSLLEAPPGRVHATGGADAEQRRTRGGRSRTGRGREGNGGSPESQTELFDDADTAAFLEAERVLDEPQREPARAIAESYREALADARDRQARGTQPR